MSANHKEVHNHHRSNNIFVLTSSLSPAALIPLLVLQCISTDTNTDPPINFRHPGTLMLGAGCQSAQTSKITNDSLTQSGTGCFIAVVPIWQQLASKG